MIETAFTEIDYTQMPYISELKAIHEKCLDCSGGSHKEVRLCVHTDCSLWHLRLGHNPTRTRRKLTDQERTDAATRLEAYRQNKNQEATN